MLRCNSNSLNSIIFGKRLVKCLETRFKSFVFLNKWMHNFSIFFSHLVVQSQVFVNYLNFAVFGLNQSSYHLDEVIFCTIQLTKVKVTHRKFFVNKNFTDLVFTSEGTFQKKFQSNLSFFMILECHFTTRSHSKCITLYFKSILIVIWLHHKNELCTIRYTLLILFTNIVAVSNTCM